MPATSSTQSLKAASARQKLQALANPKKTALIAGFFKTGPGQYGHGDIFIGVTVPQTRLVARQYPQLPLAQTALLLHSPIHEERLLALLILVEQFKKGDEKRRKEIFRFYLNNTRHINNWDLVDLSAGKIIGKFLLDKDIATLLKLAQSKDLWERRIAIIATLAFIKDNRFDATLKIARILLNDNHDLIHKAVGWMLREVGNQDLNKAEKFLKEHYRTMPRTMLRYTIEKFEATRRQKYLKGLI